MADVVRETGRRCSNWGKWGPGDELGTLNYIGPETIVRAMGMVNCGVTFSLAIPLDNTGPQINQPRRFNPIHRMILTGPDFTTGAIKRPGGAAAPDQRGRRHAGEPPGDQVRARGCRLAAPRPGSPLG
ncbi:MAG TPA: hypothetical protein VGW35_14090 [Methylomirabilota bacterium]|jgi:hypothetical protein|nr:hypothetical protein [Methylomirabilota bacterium]